MKHHILERIRLPELLQNDQSRRIPGIPQEAHNESVTQAKRVAAACFLQKWAPPKSGFPYQDWIVPAPSAVQAGKRGIRQQRSGEAEMESPEATGNPELDALLAMEAEEDARLGGIGRNDMAAADELQHNENTD